ncbi:MAG: hypothetical protein HY293_21850 [Planctomycetes bacterium]|nr:hypothetical protein [Planctomycetota bacterium]
MKRLIAAAVLAACAAGCSAKPCVDGERTSNSGFYGYGSTRTSYDPCKQKCCAPDWAPGCACSKRCPCWERHPK